MSVDGFIVMFLADLQGGGCDSTFNLYRFTEDPQ